MRYFLLILVNCGLLALFLLGLPAATRAQFAGYEISRPHITSSLICGGLCLACIANLLATVLILKAPKQRMVGLEWAGIFALLGLLQYSLIRAWINFDWLKTVLEWCQNHF